MLRSPRFLPGLFGEWLLNFYFEHHLVRRLLSDAFAGCMLRKGSTDKLETGQPATSYPWLSLPVMPSVTCGCLPT